MCYWRNKVTCISGTLQINITFTFLGERPSCTCKGVWDVVLDLSVDEDGRKRQRLVLLAPQTDVMISCSRETRALMTAICPRAQPEKSSGYLPGRMAHTGMMRWPMNFPLSSYTAILNDASVGRTTWNIRLIRIKVFDGEATALVTADVLVWRPPDLHPTPDWRHCFETSWS